MRLFFALWPDNRMRAATQGAARSLLERSSGRPVHSANYHVTLKFIGDVSDVVCRRLCAAVGSVSFEPFRLRLDTAGHWRKPRVLWLGAQRVPDELKALARDIDREAAECGIAREKRPYFPHVTVARKVSEPPELGSIQPVYWFADRFVLAVSESSPQGVRYRVLREMPTQSG